MQQCFGQKTDLWPSDWVLTNCLGRDTHDAQACCSALFFAPPGHSPLSSTMFLAFYITQFLRFDGSFYRSTHDKDGNVCVQRTQEHADFF